MLDKLMDIFGSRTKALEIMFLWKDLKPVVRQGFYDNEIGRVKEFCKKNNLFYEVSPFKVLLVDDGNYSNKGIRVNSDDERPGMFFIYISKDKDKAELAQMYEMKGDDRGLGVMLGYPPCCVNFYAKHTSEMAKGNNDFLRGTVKNSKEYRYKYFTNLGKRGMDFVILSHFPCSFECAESIEIGKKRMALVKHHFPKTYEKLSNELRGRIMMYDRYFEFY